KGAGWLLTWLTVATTDLRRQTGPDVEFWLGRFPHRVPPIQRSARLTRSPVPNHHQRPDPEMDPGLFQLENEYGPETKAVLLRQWPNLPAAARSQLLARGGRRLCAEHRDRRAECRAPGKFQRPEFSGAPLSYSKQRHGQSDTARF